MINIYAEKLHLEFVDKILKNREKLNLGKSDLSEIYEAITEKNEFYNTLKPELSDAQFFELIQNNVNDKLSNMQTFSPSEDTMDKQLEAFREIFDLETTDITVLKFSACFELYKNIEDITDFIQNKMLRRLCGDTPLFFTIRLLLDLEKKDASKSFRKLKNLGIVEEHYKYSIELSETVREIFHQEITSKDEIQKAILGQTLEASLKLSDFKHIKNQANDISKILKNAAKNKKAGVNILFWGDVGTGKTELVKTLAENAGLRLYETSHQGEYGDELSRRGRLCDLKMKLQILKSSSTSCVLLDEAQDVMICRAHDHDFSKAHINRVLENNTVPVFWTTNDISDIDKAFLRRMTYAVEFKSLSDEVRLNIWKKELKKNNIKVESKKLVELNSAYNIPPSLITNAVNTAQLMNSNSKNMVDDFEKSIKNVAALINRGKDIKAYSNDCKNYNLGLVRANLDIENLTEKIVGKEKLNFSLCLYGQSGTGKSAYARYLAKRLGIKVILKKASDLISKYTGETEQNIAKAFLQAQDEKAMLIIDEADSFLGSRQNARRSWEISQVNEMLTAMENHPYPFVCTTNMLDILDEASFRRFTFKIKFDFLTKNQIELAFKHFFNTKAPQEILSCYGLTSGDFALVNKKADYMDCKNNPQELAKLLMEEVKMKSVGREKMGFAL